MLRIALIVACIAVVASCTVEERDIEDFTVSFEPTGSGFACVMDGDAPDAWEVTVYVDDAPRALASAPISEYRVEFEPDPRVHERVVCTAVYPEGNRTASLRLMRPGDDGIFPSLVNE